MAIYVFTLHEKSGRWQPHSTLLSSMYEGEVLEDVARRRVKELEGLGMTAEWRYLQVAKLDKSPEV